MFGKLARKRARHNLRSSKNTCTECGVSNSIKEDESTGSRICQNCGFVARQGDRAEAMDFGEALALGRVASSKYGGTVSLQQVAQEKITHEQFIAKKLGQRQVTENTKSVRLTITGGETDQAKNKSNEINGFHSLHKPSRNISKVNKLMLSDGKVTHVNIVEKNNEKGVKSFPVPVERTDFIGRSPFLVPEPQIDLSMLTKVLQVALDIITPIFAKEFDLSDQQRVEEMKTYANHCFTEYIDLVSQHVTLMNAPGQFVSIKSLGGVSILGISKRRFRRFLLPNLNIILFISVLAFEKIGHPVYYYDIFRALSCGRLPYGQILLNRLPGDLSSKLCSSFKAYLNDQKVFGWIDFYTAVGDLKTVISHKENVMQIPNRELMSFDCISKSLQRYAAAAGILPLDAWTFSARFFLKAAVRSFEENAQRNEKLHAELLCIASLCCGAGLIFETGNQFSWKNSRLKWNGPPPCNGQLTYSLHGSKSNYGLAAGEKFRLESHLAGRLKQIIESTENSGVDSCFKETLTQLNKIHSATASHTEKDKLSSDDTNDLLPTAPEAHFKRKQRLVIGNWCRALDLIANRSAVRKNSREENDGVMYGVVVGVEDYAYLNTKTKENRNFMRSCSADNLQVKTLGNLAPYVHIFLDLVNVFELKSLSAARLLADHIRILVNTMNDIY